MKSFLLLTLTMLACLPCAAEEGPARLERVLRGLADLDYRATPMAEALENLLETRGVPCLVQPAKKRAKEELLVDLRVKGLEIRLALRLVMDLKQLSSHKLFGVLVVGDRGFAPAALYRRSAFRKQLAAKLLEAVDRGADQTTLTSLCKLVRDVVEKADDKPLARKQLGQAVALLPALERPIQVNERLAAPDAAQALKIAALMAQLGHRSYSRRADATRRLAAFGVQARAALRRTARVSDDPEVKGRARELLARLRERRVDQWCLIEVAGVEGRTLRYRLLAGRPLPAGWPLSVGSLRLVGAGRGVARLAAGHLEAGQRVRLAFRTWQTRRPTLAEARARIDGQIGKVRGYLEAAHKMNRRDARAMAAAPAEREQISRQIELRKLWIRRAEGVLLRLQRYRHLTGSLPPECPVDWYLERGHRAVSGLAR